MFKFSHFITSDIPFTVQLKPCDKTDFLKMFKMEINLHFYVRKMTRLNMLLAVTLPRPTIKLHVKGTSFGIFATKKKFMVLEIQ